MHGLAFRARPAPAGARARRTALPAAAVAHTTAAAAGGAGRIRPCGTRLTPAAAAGGGQARPLLPGAALGQPRRAGWPCAGRPTGQRQAVRRLPGAAATEAGEVADWPRLDERSRSRYVNQLNKEHGIEDFVEFYQSAQGGLPVAYLLHPRGHTLEVHLQGATITRWITEGGSDLLFVRSDASFAPGQAINSGVPLAFPQWRDGPLPHNGFADKLQWEVVATDLDFEFVNSMVTREDFQRGRAALLLDERGRSLLPRPDGLVDDDEWAAGAGALAHGVDAMHAQEDEEAAAAAAAAPKKRRSGRRPAAEAAAEAAAAEAAAAEAAAAEAAAGALPGEADEQQQQQGQQEPGPAQAAAEAAGADAGQVPEGPQAADAAAGEEGEEGEEGGEGEEGEEGELPWLGLVADHGVVEDPAPCIVLRLADTEETRAVWPHRFELYYKITLSESDEFPDPKGSLPRGAFPWTGSSMPLSPESEALARALDTGDEQLAAAATAAAEAAEARAAAAAAAAAAGAAPRASYSGYRLVGDDDDGDGEEQGAGGASGSGDEEQGGAGGDVEGEEEEQQQQQGEEEGASASVGELPREFFDAEEEPMQVKLEWVLFNRDPEGSEPMRFQLGALPHFRTVDQMRHGELVRVLGLGGVQTFDWSDDPRKPRLSGCEEDYVAFEGERRDTVFIGSHDADVSFCPGTRTHFELMARRGLPDHVVWHPGAQGLPGIETEPRRFAMVGAGRLALPKKLAPGEEWRGELVLRHHERYWDPPVFDRDGPQPLPSLRPRHDEADDDDGLGEASRRIEGLGGSMLGGGADVPLNDE